MTKSIAILHELKRRYVEKQKMAYIRNEMKIDELVEVLKLFYNNCKCDDNDEMRIMINKARQILAKVGA